MDNHTIAQRLMQQARYLEDREASLYRVRAYRRAAETVLGLDAPVDRIVCEQGERGLRELPGVGVHIARAIETLVRTGALPTLNDEDSSKPREARVQSRGSEAPPCTPCSASFP
jgi:DNA polymerase (family X)